MPEPLVLLHGYTATPAVWNPLLDHLGDAREVHALGLAGHTGCAPLPGGVAPSVEVIADAVEADLDRLGVQRPHVAGNSLGGWVALLLAQRGRASSVVALAPAGFWVPGSREERKVAAVFRRASRFGRLARPALPRLMARPGLRKLLLRDVMEHGDHLRPAEAVAAVEALVDCPAYPELIENVMSRGIVVGHMEFDVPVLVAQAERDRLFPPRTFGPRIRERLPQAEVTVLPGVGHVPMADDPRLIADTVLQWVARAEEAGVGAAA